MTSVVVFLQSKMKKGPGTSFVPSNASLPAATVIHTGHLLHLMKQQVKFSYSRSHKICL